MLPFFFIFGRSVFDFSTLSNQFLKFQYEFTSNTLVLNCSLFQGIIVPNNAVIYINNANIVNTGHHCSFQKCKSDVGTCAMKISACKSSSLNKMCFSNLKVNYYAETWVCGTTLSISKGSIEFLDSSMTNVIHLTPYGCFYAAYSSCVISRCNNSFGETKNGGYMTNSWVLMNGVSLYGSYCAFGELTGGHTILFMASDTIGNSHHLVFSKIKASAGVAMIYNIVSKYSIDNCICVNCEKNIQIQIQNLVVGILKEGVFLVPNLLIKLLPSHLHLILIMKKCAI